MPIKMTVFTVAISKLLPLCELSSRPDTPLMQSMMSGFTNPVLIDEDGCIIAGQLRVLAANGLGMTEAPCVTLVGLSFEQKKACAIADLYMEPTRAWDEDMLRMVLEKHSIDTARDALVQPYAQARRQLLSWLSQLDQSGRVQALNEIKHDHRWNGEALVQGLDAVLAVMDYRFSVDNLLQETGYADSDYEEQDEETDVDTALTRPVTPAEIAAELEVQAAADTAGRFLAKIGFDHRGSTVKEGLLGASDNSGYTVQLDRACRKWDKTA